jgi:hypothetical protein
MREIVNAFVAVEPQISSADHLRQSDGRLRSDDVLACVRPHLEASGFTVEGGKSHAKLIRVPLLFGANGIPEKSFDADAWHREGRFVLEVEAGRGVLNNQFLKDLFQACMMIDVDYLCVAVRIEYLKQPDYQTVVTFFDTLYASNRLRLPLRGVGVIGY